MGILGACSSLAEGRGDAESALGTEREHRAGVPGFHAIHKASVGERIRGSTSMSALNQFTGSEFTYDYRTVPELCEESAIRGYCAATRSCFAPIAKAFNNEAHTEWLVRSYLALKYVLGATVLASSAEYAEDHNLCVALPYLNYYSVFNCARAFVLTLPDYVWKGELSIELTHQNAINRAANALRRLDSNAEKRWGDVLRAARDQRELFSYRFPALGPSLLEGKLLSVREAQTLARFLTEMAQLNTECLEASVRKHAPGPWALLETDDTWLTMTYEASEESFIDHDDWSRLGWYFAKWKRPLPLSILATEGLVEDFFGAWAAEREDVYDPDENWALLLDVL